MTENFENNNRNRTIKELKAEAKKLGHTGFSKLNKAQLIDLLQEAQLMLTTGSTRLAVSRGQQT